MRAIVNVATGGYKDYQPRLIEAMRRQSPDAELFTWNEEPSGWPPHRLKPYAFKAYALNHVRFEGAKFVLWVDSVVFPVKPLEPLWEKIEREGYWIALNGWTNYEWTADSAYRDLFPDLEINEARQVNKQFPQVVATAFGLDIRAGSKGWQFLNEYFRLASSTHCFCGPWANAANPKAPGQSPERTANCGPPDVLGHRHDQTAASVIAWRLGMKLTECPEIFSYYPPAENTILCADAGQKC